MAAGWECPALPMLSLSIKESGKASFLAIKPMIAAHYEENPDSFHDEIRQLDQLREAAMRPSRDYNGISVLRRYFSQLHLLRARFPPESGQLPIDFVWKDMFSGAEYIQEGLQMEQASVLYNISAFHSILACRSKRDLEQDIKDSITHFQCAAGAFNYLEEKLTANQASRDISPPFVNFYKNLMLGQAQECFVEKSLRGSARVKPVNIAKLAARVSEYYAETTRCLETEPCTIICKKNKDWPKLLRFKMIYFQALSHFYQGAVCEESNDHGGTMAWYSLSIKKLGTVGKIPRNLAGDSTVREAFKHFTDYVQAKLAAAKKQNDQVFHERMPDLETLEQVSGTDLVKPVMFQPTDSKNQGSDIFGRLVPMRAYEVSSVYSEQKAELLRSINSSVAEKDEELEQFMKTINMSEIEKIHQGIPELPENVLEQHRSMQGKASMVKKLHADLQELMGFSDTVTKDLNDISERKEEDDKEEEEFQTKFGPRPPSQLCTSMWKELESLKTYHTQGSKSNSDLKTMFDQHYRFMVLLCGPQSSLEAAVPKMTPMDAPEEDVRDSERLKDLQAKVKEMTTQRRMLLGQLRDQMSNDDITKNLVGRLGNEADSFIEEHMKRHKDLADIIRQNLTAQENILSAVVDANAAKANVRQAVQDMTELQESMFTSLVQSGKRFVILQDKIREGLGFYSRLHDNVSKLRKKVFDVTSARSKEREAATKTRTPSATPPPVSPSPTPAAAPPRPPKKAEFAGNPLNQPQTTTAAVAPDSTHTNSSLSLQNSGSEKPQEGLPQPITMTPALVTLGATGSIVAPGNVATPTSTATLSMEEQIKLLQQQHQLQMQSLGMVPPSVQTIPQLPGAAGEAASGSGPTPELIPASSSLPVMGTNVLPMGSVGGAVPRMDPQGSMSLSSLNTSILDTALASSESSNLSQITSPQHLSTAVPQMEASPPQHVAQMGENSEENQAILDLQLLLQPPDVLASQLATPLNPETVHSPAPILSNTDTGGENAVDSGGVTSVSSPVPPHATYWTQAEPQPGTSTSPPLDSSLRHVSPQADSISGGGILNISSISEVSVDSNLTSPVLANTFVPSPLESGFMVSVTTSEQQHQGLMSPTLALQPTTTDSLGIDTTTTINVISRPIPAPSVTPPSSPRESREPDDENPLQEQGSQHPPFMPADFEPNIMENSTEVQPGGGHGHVSEQQNVPKLEEEEEEEEEATEIKMSEDASDQGKEGSRSPTPQLSGLQAITGTEIGSDVLPSLSTLMSSSPAIAPLSGMELTTHGIDTDLQSLPQFSELPFRSLPSLTSMTLLTPSSIHPLTLETGSVYSGTTQLSTGHMEHLQALLASNRTLQQTVDEKTREAEQNRATIADQKSQLENYKQQLLILQQQLGQVSLQQQKQEQEKATASGQQAVLMQLLQQQQGMFSQQQAQIEKLSKATELHRQEVMDEEVKHKQALSVEQERCAGLNAQNLQLNQEVQRLQQQVQAGNQQQQMVQIQLYQYQSQIQERDKHLLAFREQHKQIIQNLEQRHQHKMTQMVQQIQDLQAELKKVKSYKQTSRNSHSSPSGGSGMQHSASTRKGDSISHGPPPPQVISPMLPPISLSPQNQVSSQSIMTSMNSPGAHHTGLQRTQLDRRNSPSIQQQQMHQVSTLQPTKVQSPLQLPPIGSPLSQVGGGAVNPQLPQPMKLQGLSQQGPSVSHPQALPDGSNRTLSWSNSQQQQQQQQQQAAPRSQANQPSQPGPGTPGPQQQQPQANQHHQLPSQQIPHGLQQRQQQQHFPPDVQPQAPPQQQQQQQQQPRRLPQLTQPEVGQGMFQKPQQQLLQGVNQQQPQLPQGMQQPPQGMQQPPQGVQQPPQGMQQPPQGMQQPSQGVQQQPQGMQQQPQGMQQQPQGMQQPPQGIQQQPQGMQQPPQGIQQKSQGLPQHLQGFQQKQPPGMQQQQPGIQQQQPGMQQQQPGMQQQQPGMQQQQPGMQQQQPGMQQQQPGMQQQQPGMQMLPQNVQQQPFLPLLPHQHQGVSAASSSDSLGSNQQPPLTNTQSGSHTSSNPYLLQGVRPSSVPPTAQPPNPLGQRQNQVPNFSQQQFQPMSSLGPQQQQQVPQQYQQVPMNQSYQPPRQ